MFRIDLIPCAYEINYSDKFNVFSLFQVIILVSKNGVILDLNIDSELWCPGEVKGKVLSLWL